MEFENEVGYNSEPIIPARDNNYVEMLSFPHQPHGHNLLSFLVEYIFWYLNLGLRRRTLACSKTEACQLIQSQQEEDGDRIKGMRTM